MTIDPKLLNRINELARKQKSVGLTQKEKAEQNKLRQTYLQSIRGQVRQQLDQIQWVDEK